MATLVMKNAVIDVGSEINTELEKFKGNNQECRSICNFMETLCNDLRLLPPARIITENTSMHATMESLKGTLERMATEAKNKCRVKAFKADDIARDLNLLRLEIIQNMLSSKDGAGCSTYSLLNQKIDQKSNKLLHKILEAIKALLVPLQHKVQLLFLLLHTCYVNPTISKY